MDWSIDIRMGLESYEQGYWLRHRPDTNDNDQVYGDLVAHNAIRSVITEQILIHLRDKTTTHDAWTYLQQHFQSRSTQKLLVLKRNLEGQTLSDPHALPTHLNKLKNLYHEILAHGDNMDTKTYIITLANSLPRDYNMEKRILLNDKDIQTIDAAHQHLLENYHAFFENKYVGRNTTRPTAFHTRSTRSFNTYTNKSSHRPGNNSYGTNPHTKKSLACFYCGKVGHSKRECKSLQKDRINGRVHLDKLGKWAGHTPRQQTRNAPPSTHPLSFVTALNTTDCTINPNCFILDSASTEHITKHLSLLTNTKPLTTPTTLRGSGNGKLACTHVGEINFPHFLFSYQQNTNVKSPTHIKQMI